MDPSQKTTSKLCRLSIKVLCRSPKPKKVGQYHQSMPNLRLGVVAIEKHTKKGYILQEQYPTRYGIPIHPSELGFESDPTVYEENHHLAYTRREMGRFAITQTFRDLSSMQTPIPKEPHRELHRLYLPPEIDIQSAYEYVWEAYEHTEQLRHGSVRNFEYTDITPQKMKQIEREYQNIKHFL